MAQVSKMSQLCQPKHLVLVWTVVGILFTACGKQGLPAPAASSPLIIWTSFNDKNPQNAQDRWFAQALVKLEQEKGLKVENEIQNYAQINSKLNLAVATKGDLPDLSYLNSQQLNTYLAKGALEDLTAYVSAAPWFKDLEPAALAACTAPDGKIYCVPGHIYSRLLYYWASDWPQGFPADTVAFLRAAEQLKQQGKYALTFKGSEVSAAEGFIFSLLHSFGGKYADAEGKATWATPEVAQAVAFIRTLMQKGLAPDVVFSPGFDHERLFQDGKASAFGGGSWSYIYLYPLTSPQGKTFAQDSASVAAALEAGELKLASPLAAPGQKPVTLLTIPSWGIPKGSKQPALAKQFLDYFMQREQSADYAFASGGLPVLTSAQTNARFQTPYWQFVRENQTKYGQQMEPLHHYDRAMTILTETIGRLVLDSNLDSLTELQKAQESYNSQQ